MPQPASAINPPWPPPPRRRISLSATAGTVPQRPPCSLIHIFFPSSRAHPRAGSDASKIPAGGGTRNRLRRRSPPPELGMPDFPFMNRACLLSRPKRQQSAATANGPENAVLRVIETGGTSPRTRPPTGKRERAHHPRNRCRTRRAGCVERRSSGSTEARRSNPARPAHVVGERKPRAE